MSDERIKFALDLAKAGKKEEARAIFQDILKQDRDNVHAWAGMARVAESREQAVYCLEQVLRIKPGNEWAKNILQKLAPEKAANIPHNLAETPSGLSKLWTAFWGLATGTKVVIFVGVILGSCCGLGMIRAFFFPPADKEPPPTVTLIEFVEETTEQAAPTEGTPFPTRTSLPTATRTDTPEPSLTLTFTPSPTATETLTLTPTDTPTKVPTNTQQPTEDPNPYPGCPKMTCDDFTRCEDVREYLDYCPSYKNNLDRDDDGVPCEDICSGG